MAKVPGKWMKLMGFRQSYLLQSFLKTETTAANDKRAPCLVGSQDQCHEKLVNTHLSFSIKETV